MSKLTKCADCEKEISKNAKVCPNCGAKPKKTHPFTKLMALLGVLWMIGYATSGASNNNHVASPTPSAVQPQSGSSVSTPTPARENWTIRVDESKMDSSKSVFVSTDASNDIKYWIGSGNPSLIIRCVEKKTDVVFITGTSAQPEYGRYNEASVRIRLDDGKPATKYWTESTDNKALFASDPVGLAKKINQAKKLRLEFTPFNSNPQVAEFNVDGLSKYLPEVAKTCGWKL